MSVTIRPYKRGGWEVDIRLELPDGTKIRERKKAPVSSKSGAKRWGEARERELLINGRPQPREEAPTLEEFAPRFIENYAVANRQKPSGIAAKKSILRCHLIPELGSKKLDAIGSEDIQRLKKRLADKAPKTVNNVLSVLNKILAVAVEWDVIEAKPCTIRLLRLPKPEAEFYDFEEYSRLAEAARKVDRRATLIVLLGGDAGLRCGEMLALEWPDVDFPRERLHVRRSDWHGHVTTPKGGRSRIVPMTKRLERTLREHRHLQGPRILCQRDGSPLTHHMARGLLYKAVRKANLRRRGIHVLRHTFCSHLAMRGAPARAVQELAGHQNLSTTQRYMHLSPAAVKGAIRLLEEPTPFGDILETAEE